MQCFRWTTEWVRYTYTYTLYIYIHIHIHIHIHYIYTYTHIHIPLFFRFYPQIGHYRALCSYGRFLLVIYFMYSNMYMSIPISQSIPAPPFPNSNHKFVFYICDSILVLWTGSFVQFLGSIYKQYHMIFLLLWFTSHGMTISQFSHVAAKGILSFLWLSIIPPYIHTTSSLSVPLLMDF